MNFIKKNKYVFLTFGLSLLLISVLFIINGVIPYGKNSLLTVDFYYQYGPLLNELMDRIKVGSSFLFSFNNGLGIPFFTNFLNYLSSPFNIILFIFKQENILISFSIIIGLKACVASATIAYYIKKTFDKDNIFICIFGVLYAFSSYFAAYYWNLMWLDGMVLLPIVFLGINRLIKKGKIELYVISLILMLFSNYFIGYMICIGSVLYFIAYLIITNKFNIKFYLKKSLLFGFASLLAGAISAVFLIPMFYSLKNISATGDVFRFSSLFNFNFLYLIPNSLSGIIPTVFSNGTSTTPIPNIACGIIPLVLTICLFFNNKIKIKTKIVLFISLLIFILSFNLKPLDFIWHGFHVPNDLPYRYSFIYIFIIIVIGYYSLLNIKNIKSKYIVGTSVSLCIIAGISYTFSYFNITEKITVFMVFFLIAYTIIYLLYTIKSIKLINLKFFTIILVCAEIIFGINNNWEINQNASEYMQDHKEYQSILNEIKNEDNDFYRIEKNDFKTLNDGSWYGYKGISTFSSVAYEDTARLMRDLGLGGNYINSYYYKPNTPVFDMMFSLKYTLGYRPNNNLYEENYYNETDIPVYKFSYSLSPVFAVSENIKSWNIYSNPIKMQNDFIYSSTGLDDTFTKIIPVSIFDNNDNVCNYNGSFILIDKNTTDITITLKGNGNTYLYIYNEQIEYFVVNGNYYYISANEPFVLDTGLYNEDITIEIYFKEIQNEYVEFYAYNMDENKFINAYNILEASELKIDNYSDTRIMGTIQTFENQTVFTSLSYDDGWRVYIDDEEVETFKIGNALLGFDITPGSHKIELAFYPKEINTGITISIIGLIIFMGFIVIKKRIK